MSKLTCYDHLGNKFNSRIAMCKHYNIAKKTFEARLKRGWNFEDALTVPTKVHRTHQQVRESRIAQAAEMWNNSKDAYENYEKEKTEIVMKLIAARYKITVDEMKTYIAQQTKE